VVASLLRAPARFPVEVGAVLFDMDGLLVDSEPLWSLVTDAFCQRRGARYDAEDAAACMGRGIGRTVDYLAARYGWVAETEAHAAEISDHFAREVPGAPACAGADALLRALQGRVPIALGSSSARRLVEAALGGKGWFSLFGAVVTGTDGHRIKPAPDIYLAAAQALGVAPVRCVVFEDSPVGCRAGRDAGAFVVAIPGPEVIEAHHRGEAVLTKIFPPDVADAVAPDLLSAARLLFPEPLSSALVPHLSPGTPCAL
jgi:HAD superfamily hydrolase (TIGR01509 family)